MGLCCPDEPTLIVAAHQLRDQAIAEGWSLVRDFPTQGTGGVYSALLGKGEMTLRVRYVTEAYFAEWPDDDDVLQLLAEIEYIAD